MARKTTKTDAAVLKPIAARIAFSRARGAMSYPTVTIDGPAPADGETILIKLENGVTYSGVVYGATEKDGKTLVEFTTGLHPQ